MNKSGEVKQSPSSTPIPSWLGSCLRDASPLAKAVYTAIQLRHCRNPRPAFLETIAQTLQGALKLDGYRANCVIWPFLSKKIFKQVFGSDFSHFSSFPGSPWL